MSTVSPREGLRLPSYPAHKGDGATGLKPGLGASVQVSIQCNCDSLEIRLSLLTDDFYSLSLSVF